MYSRPSLIGEYYGAGELETGVYSSAQSQFSVHSVSGTLLDTSVLSVAEKVYPSIRCELDDLLISLIVLAGDKKSHVCNRGSDQGFIHSIPLLKTALQPLQKRTLTLRASGRTMQGLDNLHVFYCGCMTVAVDWL